MCGEEKIEKFFESIGYKIIEPEEYSIAEQIYMVNNAQEIVTTMGSLAHFALVAKPKTRFVMLTREYKSCIVAQCLVNQASDVDWYIVDMNNNFLPANRAYGPVNMEFTLEFQSFCNEVLGVKIDLPISKDIEYIKKWVEYYSIEDNLKKINKLTVFDILNRMSVGILGKKLDKSKLKTWNEVENEKYQIGLERKNMRLALVKKKLAEVTESIKNLDDNLYFPICDIHVSGIGWILNYNFSTIYKGRKIEAIRIRPNENITYSVFSENYGWKNFSNDEYVGTVGKSIPIQMVKISCKGQDTSVTYRVASQGKWGDWCHDGEETEKYCFIEGIQIVISK